MKRRFFVDTPIASDRVVIDGAEANHIAKVNRLRKGDEIVLFDGSDREFPAVITDTGKNRISTEVLRIDPISRELPFSLQLAVALPRGDRQKTLVEKLVELGVSKLLPLNSERSVASADANTCRRLQRRVIESSKQCGRNRLMEIDQGASFEALMVRDWPGLHRFIAHPGPSEDELVKAGRQLLPGDAGVIVAIGPEGGFSDGEIDLASRCGWNRLSLGPTILRVETAAIAAAIMLGIGRLDARPRISK